MSKYEDTLEDELRGRTVQQLVDDQANDDGLWFDSKSITEAYLQRALRLLHYAIEK